MNPARTSRQSYPFERLGTPLNFILFNLLWFAGVLGATLGWSMAAPAVFLVLLAAAALSARGGQRFRNDLKLCIAGALIAYTIEPFWLARDLLGYAGHSANQQALNLPPTWITLLWMAFAMSLNHSLAWMRRSWLLLVVFAGVGSVLSILAAERLGAVHFPRAFTSLLPWYSGLWIIAASVLTWLAGRYDATAAPTGLQSDGAAVSEKESPAPRGPER